MTESVWLTCEDPQTMLDFIHGRASVRKDRLFSAACCRRIWPLLTHKPLREAVLTAERHADGEVSDQQMGTAIKATHRYNHSHEGRAVYYTARFSASGVSPWGVAHECAEAVAWSAIMRLPPTTNLPPVGKQRLPKRSLRRRPQTQQADARVAEREAQCFLARDIFGNPFRPVLLSAAVIAWQQGTVARMALAVYEQRRWDYMPLLGDALEEAGVVDQAVLDHCREPGPHARGCHVVDSILGKS